MTGSLGHARIVFCNGRCSVGWTDQPWAIPDNQGSGGHTWGCRCPVQRGMGTGPRSHLTCNPSAKGCFAGEGPYPGTPNSVLGLNPHTPGRDGEALDEKGTGVSRESRHGATAHGEPSCCVVTVSPGLTAHHSVQPGCSIRGRGRMAGAPQPEAGSMDRAVVWL